MEGPGKDTPAVQLESKNSRSKNPLIYKFNCECGRNFNFKRHFDAHRRERHNEPKVEGRTLPIEWTKPATGELLRVLTKQFKLFNNGTLPSKRWLYDNCVAYLERKGYSYTSLQCKNKWKELKRGYRTKYEKLRTGKPLKRHMFDEIEVALKVEELSLKRQMDEMSKINLNRPPGFSEQTEEEDDEAIEEEDDDLFDDYNDPEEYKDTHDSLKDNKNNVFTNNYFFPNHYEETPKHSAEERRIAHTSDHLRNSNQLVREVQELRKVIKRSLDVNGDILKTHNATHEQILICLDTLDKRGEEKLDIKRKRLEDHSELIQQVEIQNSLIAKLIQRLGNNISTTK